jgi:hypothetical protein
MTTKANNILEFGCGPTALLSISPAAHDFSPVSPLFVGGPTVSTVFTVTNPGTGASGTITTTLKMLIGATIYSGTGYSFGTNNCTGVTLAPLATCTVTLDYTPSTRGLAYGDLVVSASPGGSATATLQANAVPAVLTVTPPNHDFGTLLVGGPTVSKVFTVSNPGPVSTGAMFFDFNGLVSLDGPRFFLDKSTTCANYVTLGPLATCTITITYTPTTAGYGGAPVTSLGSFKADAVPGGSFVVTLRATVRLP